MMMVRWPTPPPHDACANTQRTIGLSIIKTSRKIVLVQRQKPLKKTDAIGLVCIV